MVTISRLMQWPAWRQLLKPRSPEDWRAAMAASIRRAPHLSADEVELLAQIAERGPPAKKGRRTYGEQKAFQIQLAVFWSLTKAEAARAIARDFKMDDEAAKQAVRRYGGGFAAQAGQDAEIVRAAMAEAKRVKAAREIEAARRKAEIDEMMARIDSQPE